MSSLLHEERAHNKEIEFPNNLLICPFSELGSVNFVEFSTFLICFCSYSLSSCKLFSQVFHPRSDIISINVAISHISLSVSSNSLHSRHSVQRQCFIKINVKLYRGPITNPLIKVSLSFTVMSSIFDNISILFFRIISFTTANAFLSLSFGIVVIVLK